MIGEIICIVIIIIIMYFLTRSHKKKVKIDDIEITERNAETQKYIKQLINKHEINDKKINTNKFQFYLKPSNENITMDVLDGNIENEIQITQTLNTNPANNVIDSVLIPDGEITPRDVRVLNNPKYLKNYYYDLYGNKINASLQDYFEDYYANYDGENTQCRGVKTTKGESGFIIPNQYPTLKYQTNAYNIDWNRIVNPLTWY